MNLHRILRISFVLPIILVLPLPVFGIDLVNVPIDSKVYPFIDRLVARGILPVGLSASKPLTRGQVADALIIISQKVERGEVSLSNVEQAHFDAFEKLFAQELRNRNVQISTQEERKYLWTLNSKNVPETQPYRYIINFGPSLEQRAVLKRTKNSDGAGLLFVRPTIFVEVEEKFVLATNFKYGALINSRDYVLHPDEFLYRRISIGNFTQVHSSEAYGKVGLPWLSLEVGKDNLWWGPGRHGALMLPDNNDSKDMVKLLSSVGPFRFTSFTAPLRSNYGHKFISGHRLEISVWDRICLGFHETVLADRLELAYLNPFTIYTMALPLAEYGSGPGYSADNLLLGGDASIKILPNIQLYGEFMVDDFQPHLGFKSLRNWDSKYGILMGIYYVNPFELPDTDFRIEYAFVNQYAYTHENHVTAYTSRGRCIGHEIGPDADDIFLNLNHWLTDYLQASLTYELERQGEGDVNKPHPSDAPDDDEWEFLSGIREITRSFSIGLSYLSIGNYFVDAEYTYSRIKNVAHELNADESRHQAVIEAGYRF